MTRLSDLVSDPTMLTLKKGNHKSRESGICLMEAVAWWNGEPHSDRPECVEPKLASFGMALNDRMLDHYREGFAVLVPLLGGTRTDGLREERKAQTLSWLTETLIPAMNVWAERSDIEPFDPANVGASTFRNLRYQNSLASPILAALAYVDFVVERREVYKDVPEGSSMIPLKINELATFDLFSFLQSLPEEAQLEMQELLAKHFRSLVHPVLGVTDASEIAVEERTDLKQAETPETVVETVTEALSPANVGV